jgi:DNA-binding NarL/FixJ family response regulator
VSRTVNGAEPNHLTPREYEVLTLAAEGLTNPGIAYRLGLSNATVRGHVEVLLLKLDAHSKVEAVVRAVQLGLIDLQAPAAGSAGG